MKALVWFRRDLRTQDNRALTEALASGLPVEAVFVYPREKDHPLAKGAAGRWYLHGSLSALQRRLAKSGIPLSLLRGSVRDLLHGICIDKSITQIYWNRIVEPEQEACDGELERDLTAKGIRCHIFADDCLLAPNAGYKADGSAYRVFTPFWRNMQGLLDNLNFGERLCPAPLSEGAPVSSSPSALDALELLPRHPWHEKFSEYWQPGEVSALRTLDSFIENEIGLYEKQRDFPDASSTSRLSPALHFGEISVARVYALCREMLEVETNESARAGMRCFLKQIGWREFGRHLLHAFPRTRNHSMNGAFERQDIWKPDPDGHMFSAWKRGETGIPLVDAGMRELWETGWMHNRVRMVAGSFLTKNLGIHWLKGAEWFQDTLVDADLANNTLGWQWVAGCGADAAPYFRIFNPHTQEKRFDPGGRYVARWLGERTPGQPIVDLKLSRIHALQRYRQTTRRSAA